MDRSSNMKVEKIVYVTDIDASKDNGAGINERGFLKAVSEFEEVICILPFPHFSEIYFNPKHTYVYGHHGKLWRYPLYALHLCYCLFKLSNRFKIKACALRIGLSPFIPLLYSYLLKIPLLLKTYPGIDPHENIPWKKLIFRWKPLRIRLQHYLLKFMYQAIVSRSVIIDCPSDTCRASVLNDKDIASEKVITIPNGVNTDFFKPLNTNFRKELGFSEQDKIIGYIGALNGEIRFTDHLIDSFEQLIKKRSDTYLLLVGDGQNRKALEQKCAKKQILKNVILTGFIKNDIIPQYMSVLDAAVDLTAVPVRVNCNIQYASYSQKIAQYLSCGVPVVCWDIEDTKFIEKNNLGALSQIFNIIDLAKKLNQIVSLDPKSWISLSKRAREYSLYNLSYAIIAQQRLQIWKRTVDPNNKLWQNS